MGDGPIPANTPSPQGDPSQAGNQPVALTPEQIEAQRRAGLAGLNGPTTVAHLAEYRRTAEAFKTNIDMRGSHQVDSIDENGVVRRRAVTFQRTSTPGVDKDQAEGGWFVGSDGKRYHTTGTTEDGKALNAHTVDASGHVVMGAHTDGPSVFTRKVSGIARQLGLVAVPGKNGLVFQRRGYSGTYNVQFERDGSISLHYSGGRNSAGRKCYPQTYHHGRWDLGRRTSRASINPEEQQRMLQRYTNQVAEEQTASAVLTNPSSQRSGFYHEKGSVTSDGTALTTSDTPSFVPALSSRLAHVQESGSGAWRQRQVLNPTTNVEETRTELAITRRMSGTVGVVTFSDMDLARHGNAEERDLLIQAYSAALEDEGTLLLDKKIAITMNGRERIIQIAANGDVIDETGGRKYTMGLGPQGVTWTGEALVQSRTTTIKPTQAPTPGDSTDTPVGLTPDQIQKIKTDNLTLTKNEMERLLTADKATGFYPVAGLVIPVSNLQDEVSGAQMLEVDGKKGYALTRTVKDANGNPVPGILFVRDSDENTHAYDDDPDNDYVVATLRASVDPETKQIVFGGSKPLEVSAYDSTAGPNNPDGSIDPSTGMSVVKRLYLRSDGTIEEIVDDQSDVKTGNVYIPDNPPNAYGTVEWKGVMDATIVDGRVKETPEQRALVLTSDSRNDPPAPDAGTPLTAEQTTRNENLKLAKEMGERLLESPTGGTGFYPVDGLTISDDPMERHKTSGAQKVEIDGKVGYVITRMVSDGKGNSVPGILFIRQDQDEARYSSNTDPHDDHVIAVLKACTGSDNRLILEDKKPITLKDADGTEHTREFRLRSDGSIEEFIDEEKGNLYFTGKVPNSPGVVIWQGVDGAPIVNGRVEPNDQQKRDAKGTTDDDKSSPVDVSSLTTSADPDSEPTSPVSLEDPGLEAQPKASAREVATEVYAKVKGNDYRGAFLSVMKNMGNWTEIAEAFEDIRTSTEGNTIGQLSEALRQNIDDTQNNALKHLWEGSEPDYDSLATLAKTSMIGNWVWDDEELFATIVVGLDSMQGDQLKKLNEAMIAQDKDYGLVGVYNADNLGSYSAQVREILVKHGFEDLKPLPPAPEPAPYVPLY